MRETIRGLLKTQNEIALRFDALKSVTHEKKKSPMKRSHAQKKLNDGELGFMRHRRSLLFSDPTQNIAPVTTKKKGVFDE